MSKSEIAKPERKRARGEQNTFLLTLLSIVLAFALGGVVLWVSGYDPFAVYRMMFEGVFSKPKYLAWTLLKAQPIIITGLSVTFAYRTGLFNIGAEGQYIVGLTVAALVGHFTKLPPVIHPLAVILIASAAAALVGALAGWLKARFGINEVISGIMLNWIAFYAHNVIVAAPFFSEKINISYSTQPTANIVLLEGWKKTEEGKAWLANNPFWRDVLSTPINWGLLIALALVIVVWFVLARTKLGYELRAVGSGRDAAKHSGINIGNRTMTAMAIAGAIAGCAGAVQLLGITIPHRLSNLGAMEGYGFDGLAVALMGNSTALGTLLSGLFFAVLKYGGSKVNADPVKAPPEVVSIMIGVIMLCVSAPRIFSMIRLHTHRSKGGVKE